MGVVVAARGFYVRPARVVIALTAVHKLAGATTWITGATMQVDNDTNVAAAMATTTRLPPALR